MNHALNSVIAAVLLSGVATSAFAATYKVDTLPQAPDTYGSTLPTLATHINSRGEAVGSTSVGESGTGAVYWSVAGQVTNLTPGDSPVANIAGISDAGAAVYSNVDRIYSWINGVESDLGAGYAYAVNGKGMIAGTFGGIFGIWANGVVTQLPLPTAGSYATASGINNNGDVIGVAFFSDTNSYRAAIWRNGTMQPIGTLPGDVRSFATAINDAGQVVGISLSSSNKWRAFLWDNGVISDLSLAGDAHSFAYGINNAGQVTGGFNPSGSSDNHPFVWQSGVRTDLAAVLGQGNCTAFDINDNGATVANCTATVLSGQRSFRLTPVASAGDLSLNFSATPLPATVGIPLVYTATITNIGNATTVSAALTQNLPASGFAIDSIITSKGSCSGSTTVNCSFGDLAPGTSAVVTVTATPLAITGTAAYFDASAAVTSATPEVNTVNNMAKMHFAVFPNNAALRVDSKNSQTSATKGSNITYTWEVTNSGPQAARNVILTDTLPSGLSFVSANTTAGTCTGTTTVQCNLGDQKYSPITVTIVAKAKTAGTISNSATVTSTTPDTYLGDNKATVVTKVR